MKAKWYSARISTGIVAINTSLSYSSAKTAQKRMDKLEKAGIRCKLTGYNGGYIEFLGYTPETEALLEKERQEVIIAHQAWQVKQMQTA